MKRFVFLWIMLLCLNACEQEGPLEKYDVSLQRDFQRRYRDASIISVSDWDGSGLYVKFSDEQRKEAEVFYKEDGWNLCISYLKDFTCLPEKVQESFLHSPYADAKIEAITSWEREELSHTLYRIFFKYQWKDVEDMTYEVLMDEEGVWLHTYNRDLPNNYWYQAVQPGELDFIQKRYPGSDVRGYINDGGYNVYFFIQDGVIKQISFSPVNCWYETRYELPFDTSLPDLLVEWLEREDPDFSYTKIFYVESPEENAYELINENTPNNEGIIVRESLWNHE